MKKKSKIYLQVFLLIVMGLVTYYFLGEKIGEAWQTFNQN